MIDFLWQFGFNLKMPMTVFWMLALLLSALTVHENRKALANIKEHDPKYGTVEWRVWTAANVAFVVSVLWLLVMAIPAPDFKREVVEKTVVKVVEKKVPVDRWRNTRTIFKLPTYEQSYRMCAESHPDGVEEAMACHKIATEASMPLPRVITRTITQEDPYRKLFETCMDHDSQDIRTEVMLVRCHSYASRNRIISITTRKGS